jgi:hypothetical protein
MVENNSAKHKEEPLLPKEPDRTKSAYLNLLVNYFFLQSSIPWMSLGVLNILNMLPSFKAERKKTLEEQKVELLKKLEEMHIDPVTFDILLANETDRTLKVYFGRVFLILTFLFTSASYSIVILDGIYGWNISTVAITSLIIETPIQFIGLLYIIARNLFPQVEGSNMRLGGKKDIKQSGV